MLQFMCSDELTYNVSAYFAHSETVKLFLTLGVGKNAELLRANNYAEMNQRKFRSSVNAPFAANVAAIRYVCPNNENRTKVMLVLNQRPMEEFGFCKSGLCNLGDLKRIYARFNGANCEDIFCVDSNGISPSLGISVVVLMVLSLIFQCIS